MESTDTKTCPYCAETILAEAVKCRYCGSILHRTPGSPENGEHWVRVEQGRRIAGVCTGLARELNAPGLVLPIRVFFILTTFLSGFGLVLYALLWLLMPSQKKVYQPGAARSTAASKQTHTSEVLTVPDSSSGTRPSDRQTGGRTALIGVVLVAIGAVILMSRLGVGWWDWPQGLPHFHMPDMPFFPPFWEFDMFPFPVVAGIAVLIIFVMLIGVLRFFKVVLGCGLIAVSLLFLLVLVPFAPAVLPAVLIVGVPVLILVGLIMLIVGGIRLLLG